MGSDLGLSGCRVLVAGAGGIGGACAVGFANQGAEVVVADVDAGHLRGLDGQVKLAGSITADLSDADECRRVVSESVDILGGLDVFVHALGVNDRRPLAELEDADWIRILTINLSSAYWLGQAVGNIMRPRQDGRLVFISSVSGWLAHPNHAPYAASKGGLNQLLRVMAREWAAEGVRVNAVAPGYIETELTRDYLDAAGHRAELTSLVPTGRLGKPEEVVGPVLFLASKLSDFVTGQVLYVDGGRTLV